MDCPVRVLEGEPPNRLSRAGQLEAAAVVHREGRVREIDRVASAEGRAVGMTEQRDLRRGDPDDLAHKVGSRVELDGAAGPDLL
jgi:hypothetical protein